MEINVNHVKIGDIELSGQGNLDILIAKAKELYLWRMDAKSLQKSEDDIDLEKIFDEKVEPKEEENEFFKV